MSRTPGVRERFQEALSSQAGARRDGNWPPGGYSDRGGNPYQGSARDRGG